MSDNRYSTSTGNARDEKLSAWVKPCTVFLGSIAGVKAIKSTQKGTPGIKVIITTSKKYDELKDADGNTPFGQKIVERWWTSEAAMPYTLDRLALIGEKLGLRTQLDEATRGASSDEEFAAAVMNIIGGKEAYWLAGGDQQWITDDETGKTNLWVKPALRTYGFVAAATEAGSKTLHNRLAEEGDKLIRKNDPPEGAIVSSPAAASPVASGGDDVDW